MADWVSTAASLPAWRAGLALVLAPVGGTLAAQRLLACLPGRVEQAWTYRLAFFGGAALGAAVALYLAPVYSAGALLLPLATALLAAFAAGLLLTAIDMGLWEDNLRPSPRVVAEVRRYHLRVIGRPPAGPRSKRLFDLALGVVGVVLLSPLWLLSAWLIWLEDPGPILFIKNSVGKGGTNFRQLKFRSMVRNAEEETGPIPARERDERTLITGRFLRKTALDELPQLVNILLGQMSFVGPRPLRTVVIHRWLQDLPQFAERHRVQPGLAGLSQIIGGYYITPRQRLRFDRIYVRHMSLAFDIWIMLQALYIVTWARWRKGGSRRDARLR